MNRDFSFFNDTDDFIFYASLFFLCVNIGYITAKAIDLSSAQTVGSMAAGGVVAALITLLLKKIAHNRDARNDNQEAVTGRI